MSQSLVQLGLPPEAKGRHQWRSLAERARLGFKDPPFTPEFPPGSDAAAAPEPSRRDFLTLLSASMAMAALEGCLKDKPEQVVPYTVRPEGVTPSDTLHYATAMTIGGFASGLVATSREGRPTKLEGNPDHPASRGGTGVYEQASLLQLYDPHRAKAIRRGARAESWVKFLGDVRALGVRLDAGAGASLRFLVEPDASPLHASLRARLLKRFPKAKFYAHDPLSRDAIYEGTRLALGEPLEPRPDLAKANVVVSLDADFLSPLPANRAGLLAFTARRDPARAMSRLYAVESAPTVTGMFADHRQRLRSSDVADFALALAQKLGLAFAPRAPLSPAADKLAAAIAKDLRGNRGAAVVIAGERQPAAVHALAVALNEAIGAVGDCLEYGIPLLSDVRSGPAALRELSAELRAGAVDTLVVTAWNPAYSAPGDLELASAFTRAENLVYTGLYEDETSRGASWFVPRAHWLESWGDARSFDGTATLVQPLIEPLYGGFTDAQVYAAFLGEGDKSAHDLVQDAWRASRPDVAAKWDAAVQSGAIASGAAALIAGPSSGEAIAEAIRALPAPLAPGELELGFHPGASTLDGRFANNAWLQELPDPVAKSAWGNPAWVSPATARALGVDTNDVVTLTYAGRTVTTPVLVLPGHADGVVSVHLGYGRQSGEHVARDVGFDAYKLRTADAPWFGGGVLVGRTGRRQVIPLTQEHWSMEGRDPAVDVSLKEFEAHGKERLDERRGPLPSLYPQWEKPGHQWGMAIDLAKCIGCNACTIACVAENNIPVVGPEDVIKGRVMHWIRIDRYFDEGPSGSVDEPQAITQPMACVHCENAPCEYVCPVEATVHSDEGLNEMVYNRCVGTRYCSNNCPYKVRRFNWFNFHKDVSSTERLVYNPDVTVRARGVMEKCTYCVQRIEHARIDARNRGGTIVDGGVVTACEQACPSKAIVFGDLSDRGSRVSVQHASERRYDVLHELNTRPRTVYLARVRNPNPELA